MCYNGSAKALLRTDASFLPVKVLCVFYIRAKAAQPKGDDLMAEERTLYEFTISGANYYDGARNTITQSSCTLTNQRLIIRDSRGRTQQINLRNITSVNPRIGLVNKDLELKMGTTSTLLIYGNKGQLLDIARMINEAMATPS